jgi:hypothetical protein
MRYFHRASLEVGRRIWARTGIVVLIEVRLERACDSAVLWLVTQRSTRVDVQVIVVSRDLVLTLLHAPEHERNATEEQHTTHTADNAANDLLVALAQATAALAAAVLRRRRVGVLGGAGNGDGGGAGGGDFDLLAVADGGEDGDVFLQRCRDELAGPHDGRGAWGGRDWLAT